MMNFQTAKASPRWSEATAHRHDLLTRGQAPHAMDGFGVAPLQRPDPVPTMTTQVTLRQAGVDQFPAEPQGCNRVGNITSPKLRRPKAPNRVVGGCVPRPPGLSIIEAPVETVPGPTRLGPASAGTRRGQPCPPSGSTTLHRLAGLRKKGLLCADAARQDISEILQAAAAHQMSDIFT